MNLGRILGSVAAVIILMLATAGNALAHCDTLDGPVVSLAKEALQKGDVKIVLPWVAAEKEKELRADPAVKTELDAWKKLDKLIENARFAESISNNTHPNAHTSLRLSADRPFACSGLM